MTIETSTVNVVLAVFLTGAVGLGAWIVRELAAIRAQLAGIAARCPYCRRKPEPSPNETKSEPLTV